MSHSLDYSILGGIGKPRLKLTQNESLGDLLGKEQRSTGSLFQGHCFSAVGCQTCKQTSEKQVFSPREVWRGEPLNKKAVTGTEPLQLPQNPVLPLSWLSPYGVVVGAVSFLRFSMRMQNIDFMRVNRVLHMFAAHAKQPSERRTGFSANHVGITGDLPVEKDANSA